MKLHDYPDTLSPAAAKTLALRIQQYWRMKGNAGIIVWSEPSAKATAVNPRPYHVVRSNLINGLPPVTPG